MSVLASAAHHKHRKTLLGLPGVNLVYTATKIVAGKDTGKPCVTVAVTKKHPRETVLAFSITLIPMLLEVDKKLVPTDVVEGGPFHAPVTGEIKASPLDDPKDHQKKFRPTVPGGVSAIVCGSSACTTTCWVWSRKLSQPVLLHNWHCSYLNACSDQKTVQPSPYDGGFHPQDDISTVTAGNIDNPTTDSAIDTSLDNSYATMEIFGLGNYLGSAVPNVGDSLIKSGRTTGITTGSCTALDGAANIQYPDKVRLKTDLIVTTDMLAGGDSSSPLLIDTTQNPRPLAGQGFAGGGGISLFIKIPNIRSDPAIASYDLDFDHDIGTPPPSGLNLAVSPNFLVNDGSTTAQATVTGLGVSDAFSVNFTGSDGTITPLFHGLAENPTMTETLQFTGEYASAGSLHANDDITGEASKSVPFTIQKPSTCPVGNTTAKAMSFLPWVLGRKGRFRYLVSR